jgi:hypothetical protein
MRFPVVLVGVLVILTNAPAAPGAPSPDHSLSVCKFIKQVNRFNGQIVAVRGTLVMHETDPDGASPDYLSGNCPDVKAEIVRIKVEYPDMHFLQNPAKGYRVDKRSFRRAQAIVMSTLRNGQVKDRYIATISGQAYTYHPTSRPNSEGHVTHEGSYNAGLVIEGIYNVEVP